MLQFSGHDSDEKHLVVICALNEWVSKEFGHLFEVQKWSGIKYEECLKGSCDTAGGGRVYCFGHVIEK